MALVSAQNTTPIAGDRESGNAVRTANVAAATAVSNILKTTLGPQGLDKMIVDDIGEVSISNDGATILKLLEIQHPAAKLLANLADLQDKEVGDGTTSVVLIAAELLRRANDLVEKGIHPTNVIAGYKIAMKESVKYVQEKLSHKANSFGPDVYRKVAETSFYSHDKEFFADIVVRALSNVRSVDDRGNVKYPVGAISILKCHGQGRRDSFLVNGYALPRMTRVSQAMPLATPNAKIALIDFNLRQYRLQLGVQVQIESPEELEKLRVKEKDVTKAKIEKILDAGANVVVTTQGIDDMSIKYFVERGVIAIRRIEKKDMRRLAKATGGSIVTSMTNLSDNEEIFDPSWLGSCEMVCEEKFGDWDCILFKECKNLKAQSIILRGANEFLLDELERSLHDSLSAVSRAMESSEVCAGGGAVETALAIYLEDFARTLGSREQLPIAEFATALQVIPRVLAVNAAQDAPELLARLRAKHYNSQHGKDSDTGSRWGLDLSEGVIRDSVLAGVIEATITKVKVLRVATEAAITILRIDDVIKLHPVPEPQER